MYSSITSARATPGWITCPLSAAKAKRLANNAIAAARHEGRDQRRMGVSVVFEVIAFVGLISGCHACLLLARLGDHYDPEKP